MGSVCCVPARKQGGGQENWPADPARWRAANGDLSPRWDGKAFCPEVSSNANLYRCSFSSSSRGSRRGSSRFTGHQRVSGGIFSPDPSPSSSFRGSHMNPLSSSQVCPLVDLSPLTLDASLSPCTSKESVSNTPESLPSFTSNSKDSPLQPSPRPVVTSSAGSSSSSSFVSKFAKTLRERPQKCGLTNVGSSKADESSTKGSDCGELDGTSDWSMLAFSELVASSRRERLRWMSDGSCEDLAGLAELELSALERIRAAGYATNFESFICGLCSRWLSQSSPLSAHKMVGNLDPPSVAVLACGHVFHADCLEQATSEYDRQDPPCPQCLAGDSRTLFKSYSLHGSMIPVCAKSKHLAEDPDASSSFRGLNSGLKIFSSASQELVRPDKSIKSRKFSLRSGRHSSSSTSSSCYASGSRGKTFGSASPDGSPCGRRRRGYLKW